MNLASLSLASGMFAKVVGRVPFGHLLYLLRMMRGERPHRFAGQVRINSFFPPHPSSAFERFCAAVVARRRVPYSVYVAISARCPFACPHCSYRGRSSEELSTPEALKLVAQIKDLGSCILGFTGGEPLLRDDLEELIAAARPELSTILFTTGAGLDLPRARRLAAAGVGCVTLGLESADGARHDAVRGAAGSFAQARAAAAACREAGLYLALSTVASLEKIESGELPRLHRLAGEWGARELRVLSPVATGGLAGRSEAMLGPGDRARLSRFHVETNRAGRGPVVACAAHLESDELFGCGAGFHHLFIDAAGGVCPCDLTPLRFGDLRTESLESVWRRMEGHFPRPRRGCVMGAIAPRLRAGAPLPLGREESERLVPPPQPDAPLPEGFRRLLRTRAR